MTLAGWFSFYIHWPIRLHFYINVYKQANLQNKKYEIEEKSVKLYEFKKKKAAEKKNNKKLSEYANFISFNIITIIIFFYVKRRRQNQAIKR